jgi:hypothetical protein
VEFSFKVLPGRGLSGGGGNGWCGDIVDERSCPCSCSSLPKERSRPANLLGIVFETIHIKHRIKLGLVEEVLGALGESRVLDGEIDLDLLVCGGTGAGCGSSHRSSRAFLTAAICCLLLTSCVI